MPQQNLIPAPLMWVFLFFSLAVSVATRQLIWLMVVVSLLTLITNREAILSTPGMKKAAMLFACIALPGLISLLFPVNLDRGISAVFRFAAYALAAWVVLSVKIEEGDAKRIMSFLGILLVAWAVDGFVQLLTGVSLLGDPLVELGEEGAIVTGSLQLGYGATLAILSPFFLEALRRAGGMGVGVLSLPVYAAIVMSGHQSSAVLALIGLAGWAMLALRNKEVGAKRQVTGFVISAIIGLLLGVYLSVVTGQVSTLAEAPPRYQSFLYQSQLWELSWQAFKDHWPTGVGMRGFGTFALATDASVIPGLAETWHSHLTILEVISETGLVGLIGYGVLLRWLWGYVQDERIHVAVAGLTALLAVFPLGTAVGMYSYIGGNLIFLTFTLLIALDRDCPQVTETSAP
ncbi:MAG: O-antigen ligase family protein [Pseudomonadota bacterium]|nr:O-antigen ligase family protein [Pseudomonadota bacterium]